MAKPETTFKAGAVRASVFVNTFQRNGGSGAMRKATLDVRYQDKNGEWQSTHSFSLNEIPKAIIVLLKVYDYLLSQGSEKTSWAASDGNQNIGEQVDPVSWTATAPSAQSQMVVRP